MSRYPTSADSPTTPNRITRTGVKQHKAATTVPTIPIFSSLLLSNLPSPNDHRWHKFTSIARGWRSIPLEDLGFEFS